MSWGKGCNTDRCRDDMVAALILAALIMSLGQDFGTDVQISPSLIRLLGLLQLLGLALSSKTGDK